MNSNSDLRFEEKPGDDLPEICSICALPVLPNREGSMTSWLFSQMRCSCSDALRNDLLPGAGANTAHTAVPSKAALTVQGQGQSLDGRYEIVERIGQGAVGVVYKVVEKDTGNVLAAKVLHQKHLADAAVVRRFEQEVKSTSKLRHPHLVQIYGLGRTNAGVPYLLMEYVEGKSLAVVLAECGYIAPERAVNVFMQVCEAVEHAHRNGVVHRDLKPSNMIVTGSSYYVKIVDFGIAKVLGENSGETQLTQTGEVFGSPSYMSPEQCTGNQVDGRSDIYSIGCVMYETVVGMVPFPGDNPVQVIVKHLNEPPPSFQKARPGCQIPRGLENVVMNALAKRADDRYQTAHALMSDLALVKEGKTPVRRKEKPPAKGVGQIARDVAVKLVLAPVLVIGAFWYFSRPPAPPSYTNASRDQSTSASQSQDPSLNRMNQGEKTGTPTGLQPTTGPSLDDNEKESVERELQLNPGKMQQMGIQLFNAKKYEEATPYLQSAFAHGEIKVFRQLVACYLQASNFKPAQDVCEKVIADGTKNKNAKVVASGYAHLSNVFKAENRLEDSLAAAISGSKSASNLRKDTQAAYCQQVAQRYLDLENYQQTIVWASRELELLKDAYSDVSADYKTIGLSLIAQADQGQEKFVQAQDYYRRASALGRPISREAWFTTRMNRNEEQLGPQREAAATTTGPSLDDNEEESAERELQHYPKITSDNKQIVFDFGPKLKMGTLTSDRSNNPWACSGIVRFPAESHITLDMPLAYLQHHPRALSRFRCLSGLDIVLFKGGALSTFYNVDDTAGDDTARDSIPDITVATIGGLKELRELSMKGVRISDNQLFHLDELKQLQVLNLDKAGVDGAVLSKLKILPHLTELNVGGIRNASAVVKALRNSKSLIRLDASNASLKDEDLTNIATMTDLYVLNLQNNADLHDRGLSFLSGLKFLRAIDLTNCSITSAALLPALLKLPKLNAISVSGVADSEKPRWRHDFPRSTNIVFAD